jgi:GntR family transcriptional regulator, carbon starvation induced regulator
MDHKLFNTQFEGAYWHLRRDIIDGELAPSDKLRIDQLRKAYGFGVSALREALSRLVSEGLVESEGQRGFWVAPISREELHDLTGSRMVLEVEALRQSIQHGSLEWEGGIVAARHSLEQTEKSMSSDSPDMVVRWEQANRQFHMVLISGCPLKWLLRFNVALYDQWQRYRHRTVLRRPIPRTGMSAEHIEIIEATLSRDSEKACVALSKHIANTSRAVEMAIFGR